MSIPEPSDPHQHIPVPRTSLVGREREVEEVADLLRRPDVLLVTLTGPGGVGKTRLAVRVASELDTTFRDGVWFVPCGPLHDPELVVPTIAQSLGMRDTGDMPVEARLNTRLRDAEMLLVLDNVEQVVGAWRHLAGLLRACPGVKMLVTSRVVLRITGEHVYAVPTFSVPDDADIKQLSELTLSDAVRLFVARAQAANPTFRLDTSNAAAVIEICRRLDGLPLAIELAAARTRMLSAQALHAQLTHRLTLLTGGAVDVPERHRTMRDAVEWSVNLLTPPEQVMFRRLAVISGHIMLGVANAVAGDGVLSSATGDEFSGGLSDIQRDSATLEILSSLVDQSLIQPVQSADGEPRFTMLQTIRELGLELLEANDESNVVARRYADYILSLAERAAGHLTGPDQAHWLNLLDEVHDDLRATFDWFKASPEPDLYLRLAVAVWRFGYTRGHLSEARDWLHQALERAPDSTAQRPDALNAAGLLASVQGDTSIAVACHESALELSRERGDRRGVAVALNGLGDAAAVDGDRALASERYEAALAIFREIDDRRGTAGALTNLGNLRWDDRDLAGARLCHEEALALFREIDERRGIAWGASNIGTLFAEMGEIDTAAAYLSDAMEVFRELGDPSGIVTCLEGFAELAGVRGQHEREAVLYSAAHAIRDAIGAPVPAADRARYDAVIEGVRREVGSSFDAIWAIGQAMSLDEAVASTVETGPLAPFVPPRPELPAKQDEVDGLTRRELEVLREIAAGKANKEISDELSISVRTVSTHVSNILSKLGVSTRSAAAAYAHREGLT